MYEFVVSDNYVHDGTVGIFDKDGGTLGDSTNQSTYMRNSLTGNSGDGGYDQFTGNNQGDSATVLLLR